MFVTSLFVKFALFDLDEEELLHLLQLGGLLPRPLPLLVSNLTHKAFTLIHLFNVFLTFL